MATLENINEIKSEFGNLMEYVESNYTDSYGWTVDGEAVLRQLYKLSELIYCRKVEDALIPYENE